MVCRVFLTEWAGASRGGVRPFHQKSTCLTQLTSGPYALQIWSRNTPNFSPNKTFVLRRAEVLNPFFSSCILLFVVSTCILLFSSFRIALEPRGESTRVLRCCCGARARNPRQARGNPESHSQKSEPRNPGPWMLRPPRSCKRPTRKRHFQKSIPDWNVVYSSFKSVRSF